jgi:hypothetical protein
MIELGIDFGDPTYGVPVFHSDSFRFHHQAAHVSMTQEYRSDRVTSSDPLRMS